MVRKRRLTLTTLFIALALLLGNLIGVGAPLLIDQWIVPVEEREALNLPDPDITIRLLSGRCYGWHIERREDFVGISPKVWICEDGYIMHDQSGINLPFSDKYRTTTE